MFAVNGKLLKGFSVGENKFQGVTTLAQIQDYGLIRPTLVDKTSKGLSSQEKAVHELHSLTNRTFDKPRLNNAADYSGYIEAVEVHNRPGGTPAVTLFHREKLEETDDGLLVPYGAALVAIDGETQTEARFILMDRVPSTANHPIAITLYHGISVETAMQILHDYNTKGLAWTETKAARFNHTGQLSQAAQQAIELSTVPQEQINYRGNKATKKHVLSLQQILTGMVGYQLNGRGSETSVTASHFKRFNDMNAISVPPTCIQYFAEIISASTDWSLLGHAPAQLWQIAGVLMSKNLKPSQIDWQAGMDVYEKTKADGRGGPRMAVKTRLVKIEQAMTK